MMQRGLRFHCAYECALQDRYPSLRVEAFTDNNPDKWMSFCQGVPESLLRHFDRFSNT